MHKILFELTQEYYLPSFLPIYKEMKNDPDLDVYFRVGPNQKRFLGIFLIKQKKRIKADLHKLGLKTTDSVTDFDAVICGTTLKNPQKYGDALLFNVDHGPGLKTLRYREFLKQKDFSYHVFIEGDYREEKFKKYGLDKIEKLYKVGLPKLDPFFNQEFDKEKLLRKFKLNPSKKTVLYAPSYKPTSIFEVAKTIEQLISEYNLIIKLHPYSWNGKYASHSQHKIFEKLAKRNPHIHLVEKSKHNMMPYLFVADTMISDGSSVINEFLALGRCGIIFDLDYSKLKHSDGQPLLENNTKDWLTKSFVHLSDHNDLVKAVKQAITPNPERKKHLAEDCNYIFSHTDGKSGKRVADTIKKVLEKNDNKKLPAVILAAGKGTRLGKLSDENPKPMTEVNGKMIIDNLIESLIKNGLKKIIVATGYLNGILEETVNKYQDKAEIICVYNEIYGSTNNIYSLWLTKKYLKNGFYLFEADVFFENAIMQRLINSEAANVMLVGKHNEMMDGTVVSLNAETKVLQMYLKQHQKGEFDFSNKFKTVNFYKIGKTFYQEFYKTNLDKAIRDNDMSAYYELILKYAIDKNYKFYGLKTGDLKWWEIDTKKDLKIAENLFS